VKGSASVSQGGIYGLTPGPIIYPYVGNGPGSRFAPGYWYVLDPSSNDSLVSSPEARLGPPAFFVWAPFTKNLTLPAPPLTRAGGSEVSRNRTTSFPCGKRNDIADECSAQRNLSRNGVRGDQRASCPP